MKPQLILTLAAGVLALAGCSSTPAKVDRGPIRAASFSFVNPGVKAPPAYAERRHEVHAAIQEAITKHLESRGLTRVATGGDLTVAYLIVVGNNVATISVDDYFGYGSDAADLHDKAQEIYTGSKNPNYFEAGTLIIDLIDSASFKLLKRGYATRPLLRDPPADVRAERLQEVVDEILGDLRLASGSGPEAPKP